MDDKGTFSKLREEEKGRRRSIIVDAAEKEFSSKSFEKVNMRDIARSAGISPASIYRHFPDQQSLFVEAFRRGTTKILEKIHTINKLSAEEQLEEVSLEFIDFFSKNDHYFRVMLNFFFEGPVRDDVFDVLNDIEKKLLDEFDMIFNNMKTPGEVRMLSHALFAALTGILAIFRGHPRKTEAAFLAHRKRIAGIIVGLFKSAMKKEAEI